MLAIKAREGDDPDNIEEHIFSERYLLERPLLAAIRQQRPPVLLIDEIDRADEEFEAFLFELLSDFQISIPKLGTITATSIPRVVLTSNGTRELSDALRRRCLYHYVDFPDVEREARILLARLPNIDAALALQIATMVESVRHEGASSAESFAKTDFRHMTDPAEIQAAYALAERLARSMRVRLTPRPSLARAPRLPAHDPPQHSPWRHTNRTPP